MSKLGKYIELSCLRNSDSLFSKDSVVGLSTQKQLISTKASLECVNLSTYKLLSNKHFAYVPDTSRRGDKMSLGYNTTGETFLVSPISVVFRVRNTDKLLSDYLYMYFNRPEFDRYVRFHSWGSAREAFSWEDMCNIEISLPPLSIQQKYVDIYNAMLANQMAYEAGITYLKRTCDGCIEHLLQDHPRNTIGQYITQSDSRNSIGLQVELVRGLAVSKEIIPTKADMKGVSLDKYKLVPPRSIAYVPDTSRRGDKMSLGFNRSEETYLVSSISTVFSADKKSLLPEYLMMFFCRSEFDRYSRYHSWGSARETFNWDDMCNVQIPIPEISVQQSIVDIYNSYITRKELNEKLKMQIKNICPILIKGSLEEAAQR